MKITKSSNPVRLIAFFLTAFLLVCTFGFTVDGWQMKDKEHTDSSQAAGNGSLNQSEDQRNPADSKEEINEPEPYIPQYVNRLTGIETSEEIATSPHMAFILDPDIQSYGISAADLICQIPTEDGSRMVVFIPEKHQLWKIGSITKSRGYISNIIEFFGGMCISGGNDDSLTYEFCDISKSHLDLSINKNYYYTEFTSQIYTNSELLSSAILANGVNFDEINNHILPYDFVDFGSEPLIFGEDKAMNIILNNPGGSSQKIFYNEQTSKYSMINNGIPLTDCINGKTVEFENCFILFADSITYDNLECTQMIMKTIGSGIGYYLTRGGVCEINWSSTLDGTLKFSLSNGEPLIINRGSVYINYQKSSMKEKIIFE